METTTEQPAITMPTPEEARDLETALTQVLARCGEIDTRIDANQRETDRLQVETQRLLGDLRQAIDRLRLS